MSEFYARLDIEAQNLVETLVKEAMAIQKHLSALTKTRNFKTGL